MPAGMFTCTKRHFPLHDLELQPTQQPNMVLFFFIELRGRTSHCLDPSMFCVSSSHKSCKYRQTVTLSEKNLSTKYNKVLSSECVLYFPERAEQTAFLRDKQAPIYHLQMQPRESQPLKCLCLFVSFSCS